MELKKSKKADLENKRALFFEVGLVVTLAILLLAFEWTTEPAKAIIVANEQMELEEEIVPVTRQQQETPPPPPPPPQVIEVLNIVEDDVDIEEIDFESFETDEDTEFEIVAFDEEEEEAADEVFFIVEDMPKFKGGDLNDFRVYVQKRIRYPDIAQENGIQGRVFVQFAVDAKGEVVNAVVIRGVDPALDKEALRVVKSSPKWTPGKQRGRPVKVQFTFPITFQLQ